MNPTRGLGEQFFSETAQKALSAPATRPTNRKNSAWQQNISAWWLMNAALGYW